MIRYVCSNGKTFDLYGKNMRATSGSFHQIRWKQIASERKFGEKVTGFKKESMTYNLTLTFRGSLLERKQMLNELIDCFEYDVMSGNSGKIYFGDFYANCYVIETNTRAAEIVYWSECEITIYCPNPFWIREQHYSFDPKSTSFAGAFLNYQHDYPYDYSTSGSKKEIVNDHYGACDFEMNIFGPCVNPAITIGGHLYEVITTVGEDEYLQIKSREGSVVKISKTGEQTNEFNSRNTDYSVFEKIQPGRSDVTWDGSFGFDITLFIERSEPEWTL